MHRTVHPSRREEPRKALPVLGRPGHCPEIRGSEPREPGAFLCETHRSTAPGTTKKTPIGRIVLMSLSWQASERPSRGVKTQAFSAPRPVPIPWMSFGIWTCSGSQRRQQGPSTPPRPFSRPHGSRWRAAGSLRDRTRSSSLEPGPGSMAVEATVPVLPGAGEDFPPGQRAARRRRHGLPRRSRRQKP